MAKISSIIEIFIKDLLKEANGEIEIQRNELAEQFNCAPSQINYVLTTRFPSHKGYYVESRRGGGGYIRIVKVGINDYKDINNIIVNAIGDSITINKSRQIIEALYEEDLISHREMQIINATICDRSLDCDRDIKNKLRANILKNVLLVLVK